MIEITPVTAIIGGLIGFAGVLTSIYLGIKQIKRIKKEDNREELKTSLNPELFEMKMDFETEQKKQDMQIQENRSYIKHLGEMTNEKLTTLQEKHDKFAAKCDRNFDRIYNKLDGL